MSFWRHCDFIFCFEFSVKVAIVPHHWLCSHKAGGGLKLKALSACSVQLHSSSETPRCSLSAPSLCFDVSGKRTALQHSHWLPVCMTVLCCTLQPFDASAQKREEKVWFAGGKYMQSPSLHLNCRCKQSRWGAGWWWAGRGKHLFSPEEQQEEIRPRTLLAAISHDWDEPAEISRLRKRKKTTHLGESVRAGGELPQLHVEVFVVGVFLLRLQVMVPLGPSYRTRASRFFKGFFSSQNYFRQKVCRNTINLCFGEI